VDDRSAYDRIGGAATVAAAAERLCRRLLDDERLASHVGGLPLDEVEKDARQVLTQMLGGPARVDLSRLRNARTHLCISHADYAATCGHMLAALAEVGAPVDVREHMRTVAVGLEPVIVRDAPGSVATSPAPA